MTKTKFLKKSKAVFISIRYRKTSQTQDVKSQSTERSVPKLAGPKRDSAFEREKRIWFKWRDLRKFSKRFSLVTTKEKSKPALKKTFLERTQRLFGNFVFCFR